LSLSSDGEHVAVERLEPKKITLDVWTIESASGFASRTTSDGRWAGTPQFARNGDLFFSMLVDLLPFRVTARGNERTRSLPGGPVTPSWLSDVSPDGRYVLLTQVAPDTLSDIWLLDTTKSSGPEPLLRSGFSETSGAFSSDVKRIVYSSDRTGRPEIYVNSFPALDKEVPLSESGGILPRWSRHGHEIVYMSTDRRRLLAVDVSGSKPGAPHVLFELPKLSTDASVARTRNPYAVTEDGQRFLMLVALDEPVPPSLIVGRNWHADSGK
jgi:dipeptidyl aminopeptidase/acylaminoacyl peptidase